MHGRVHVWRPEVNLSCYSSRAVHTPPPPVFLQRVRVSHWDQRLRQDFYTIATDDSGLQRVLYQLSHLPNPQVLFHTGPRRPGKGRRALVTHSWQALGNIGGKAFSYELGTLMYNDKKGLHSGQGRCLVGFPNCESSAGRSLCLPRSPAKKQTQHSPRCPLTPTRASVS